MELLHQAGGALEFDALVGIVATAQLVEPHEADGVDRLVATGPPVDALLEQRQFLEHVWTEVQSLPLRQRIALLLNLRDSAGRGMLWLFPVCGVAKLRDIASALEIAFGEFAALWREIPLDDAAIARRLGCERQQVINLRMAARKRLSNRTGGAAAASGPGGPVALRKVKG